MVDAFDFPELNGVDSKCDVSVFSEESGVVLVMGFVSEAHTIFFDLSVTTYVEDCR